MSRSKKTAEEKAIIAEARKRSPRCRRCNKQMEPAYEYFTVYKKYEDGSGFRSILRVAGVRYYGYSPDGLFCSLRCGYEAGVIAARRGVQVAKEVTVLVELVETGESK